MSSNLLLCRANLSSRFSFSCLSFSHTFSSSKFLLFNWINSAVFSSSDDDNERLSNSVSSILSSISFAFVSRESSSFWSFSNFSIARFSWSLIASIICLSSKSFSVIADVCCSCKQFAVFFSRFVSSFAFSNSHLSSALLTSKDWTCSFRRLIIFSVSSSLLIINSLSFFSLAKVFDFSAAIPSSSWVRVNISSSSRFSDSTTLAVASLLSSWLVSFEIFASLEETSCCNSLTLASCSSFFASIFSKKSLFSNLACCNSSLKSLSSLSARESWWRASWRCFCESSNLSTTSLYSWALQSASSHAFLHSCWWTLHSCLKASIVAWQSLVFSRSDVFSSSRSLQAFNNSSSLPCIFSLKAS